MNMIRQHRFYSIDKNKSLSIGDFHLFIITSHQRSGFLAWIKQHKLTIVYESPKAYNSVHPGSDAKNKLYILTV